MIKTITIPLGICLVNLLLAGMFSYAIEAGMRSPTISFSENFANSLDMLGPVSAVGGFIDLIIAIFLLAYRKNKPGAGFLLSAVVLLSAGFFLSNYYN